jgi:glycosyltransferase involved in cell wall biosynthesis
VRRAVAAAKGLPTAWRRGRAQPLKALVRALAALPARPRSLIARILVVLATRRGPGVALRPIGETLRGRRTDALAAAERVAAEPGTSTATRLGLTRGALAVDAIHEAGRILATLEPDQARTPGALALRADVAYRTGRYRDALDMARTARSAGIGSPALPAIELRAASELRVLEPGWRPALRGGRRTRQPVQGRILHLVTNSLPHRQAGYTVRTHSIVRAQREAGLEPAVATQAGFPANEGIRAAPRLDEIDGIAYHRLDPDFDRWRGPDATVERTAREADRLVRRLRPALLHPASNYLNAQSAFALRDRYGLPVVYEVRGFLEETWASRQAGAAGGTGGADAHEGTAGQVGLGATPDVEDADRYRGARAAETAAMLDADAVVTLSETMRADIVGRGADPERVAVIPNAVDVDRFRPVPRDPALAARMGLDPAGGTPVLGYVSSFTGYEGIRYLIDAAAILRDRGRRVQVLLVGDGEDRPVLEARAREHGLDDGTVIFTGRVPHGEVLAYYALIDVFVVPRTADRVSRLVTPLKPYEAMALERALLVSGVDALGEIVTPGETGLVFRPEDARDLADTVEPLLDDPGERARLGRQARDWVAANRTWHQNGQRYLELYRRLGAA